MLNDNYGRLPCFLFCSGLLMLIAIKCKLPVDVNKAYPYELLPVGERFYCLPFVHSFIQNEVLYSGLERTSMIPFCGGLLKAPKF